MSRRSKKDIWEGLFEFPLIETSFPMDFEEISETPAFKELFCDSGATVFSKETNEVKHVLTHQILYTKFYKAEIGKENSFLRKYRKVPLEKIDDYAVSRLIHRYLSNLE